MHIPFNKLYLTGRETEYIAEVFASGKLTADGIFAPQCRDYFKEHYGFENTFLTASCTDALEMMALLLEIQKGDEVIIPAYTFVSSANPFILRGATIRFADSLADSPNIDPEAVRKLINEKTRAILVMHYAGQACDMNALVQIANENNIPLLEDAAHAVDAFFDGKPLGSFGAMSAFSFHASKNIVAAEGGLLVVNDRKYVERAQLIFEKGTNRSAFGRGEVPAYEWVDIGSSFAASELSAACLFTQLQELPIIQERRIALWNYYAENLNDLSAKSCFQLPVLSNNAKTNAHLFYIVCRSKEERIKLSSFLKDKGIETAFHYQALHTSQFYLAHHPKVSLPSAEHYSDCLLRLPLYPSLSLGEAEAVVASIKAFYEAE